MNVRGRSAAIRHMKGEQVAMTLNLSPKKYWLLKWVSQRTGESMRTLVRQAIDQVLEHSASLR